MTSYESEKDPPAYPERFFEPDEMQLITARPFWGRDELLAKEGIFLFRDIMDQLKLTSLDIRLAAERIRDQGRSAYQEIGVKKIWNHWIVRMKVFAPYYRTHLRPTYSRVPAHWDINTLLGKKGLYLLKDVSPLLPLNDHQLRYHVRKNPNHREELGIWKHEKLGLYVVRMEVFAVWMRKIWNEDAENITPGRPKKDAKKDEAD